VGPCGTYAEYEGKYFMQERGFICQSCHMPAVDRPVADNGPIRRGRRHLWRGGHDPDMVKRAAAIQVKVTPAAPKPGDKIVNLVTGQGGILYATIASSETCNGRMAFPQPGDPYVTISECVHADDVAAAFPKA
jgi:hypothetical protein